MVVMDPEDRPGPEQATPIVFNAEMVQDFRELVIHLTMFDMGARIAGRVDIQLELWRDLVMGPALRLLAHMTPPAPELGPGDAPDE
jgi:hypothetical protein